jgi:flavin-dependent dehydrogenase
MQLKDKLLEAFSEFLEKAVGSTVQEQQPEVLDEEMVSYEVIYEPFTKDAHGEWMSDKTIEKAMENFNKNLEKGIVQPNLFHLKDTEAFTIESTWIQKELDVQVVQTGEVIKAGTWVAKIKYNDAGLWQLKKAGIVGGVSIGATGVINQETGEITNVKFDGEG